MVNGAPGKWVSRGGPSNAGPGEEEGEGERLGLAVGVRKMSADLRVCLLSGFFCEGLSLCWCVCLDGVE